MIYYRGEIAAESLFARLTCLLGVNPLFSVYVPQEVMLRWFARYEGSRELMQGEVRLDGIPYTANLLQTEFDFMIGEWVLTFRSARLTPHALASAADVTVLTPDVEIQLTPSEGDPEARAAFVEACLAR